MTAEKGVAPAAPSRVGRPTDRMLIAGAAIATALGEAGVVRGHDGGDGRYATIVGSERLPGVVVAALRGGRYSVDLYLTAELVPLGPLAGRLREAVRRNVRAIGLEELLGPVDISFLAIEGRTTR
jgi:hypothetical protein